MLQDLLTHAHDEIFTHLISLLESGKLPHALLFSGPSGIGKKQIAQNLAKDILKTNFNAELHMYSPETAMNNYSIDQIRKLQDICQIKPYNGLSRVIILDQADRLGLQASNAFLKLLEEPPSGNYFILISSQSYRLIPTLLSRLQKFQFKIPIDQIFQNQLTQAGYELDKLAFLADGSIGKASVVFKYKKYLEAFCDLLPYSYRKELASYKQLFDSLDDDDQCNALEFLPLFESLMRDFFAYTCGFKDGQYPWSHMKLNAALSYLTLKQALKDLYQAKEAGMKLSCCFERFFLSL